MRNDSPNIDEILTDDDALLTKAQACAYLGCGPTKLYELLRDGQLAAVKLGRRTLIPRSRARSLAKSLPPYKPSAPTPDKS